MRGRRVHRAASKALEIRAVRSAVLGASIYNSAGAVKADRNHLFSKLRDLIENKRRFEDGCDGWKENLSGDIR